MNAAETEKHIGMLGSICAPFVFVDNAGFHCGKLAFSYSRGLGVCYLRHC